MHKSRTLGKASSCKIYIFLLLLCITGFIGFYRYLPGSSTLYSNDYYYITAFMVTIMFLLGRVLNNRKLKINGLFLKHGALLVLLMLVEIISTYFIVHQPIILTIKEAFYYIVPIAAYITIIQFKDINHSGFLNEVFDMIVSFSTVCSIVAIIAFLLNTYNGFNILRLNITLDSYRNGTLRFNVGGIVLYLGVFISIIKLIERDFSWKHIINIAVCAYQIIFINKTRTVMLYIVAVIAISILNERKLKKSIRILMWLIIVVSIVGAFVFSDSVNTTVTSYLYSDAGFMMRLRAIEHYMNQFAQYPILGIGLISSSQDISGWQLLYGSEGRFFRGDVGVIGLLNEFGILGLLWVVVFFLKTFKEIKGMHDLASQICRCLLWFLLISMINLSFMDNNRCMYIFFAFAFIECIKRNRKASESIIETDTREFEL